MVSELEADYRAAPGEAATRIIYVDGDEETMATVATYVERESADLEFVGTTDAAAAAESVRTDGWDCLVVGGDLSAADRRALVDAAACPIVSFTTAGRDADADPVVAAAALVLEKGTDERILAMLVNKATQFAGTGPNGDDESLARTLARLGTPTRISPVSSSTTATSPGPVAPSRRCFRSPRRTIRTGTSTTGSPRCSGTS